MCSPFKLVWWFHWWTRSRYGLWTNVTQLCLGVCIFGLLVIPEGPFGRNTSLEVPSHTHTHTHTHTHSRWCRFSTAWCKVCQTSSSNCLLLSNSQSEELSWQTCWPIRRLEGKSAQNLSWERERERESRRKGKGRVRALVVVSFFCLTWWLGN